MLVPNATVFTDTLAVIIATVSLIATIVHAAFDLRLERRLARRDIDLSAKWGSRRSGGSTQSGIEVRLVNAGYREIAIATVGTIYEIGNVIPELEGLKLRLREDAEATVWFPFEDSGRSRPSWVYAEGPRRGSRKQIPFPSSERNSDGDF
jgi:hypothetical protein